MLPRKRRVMREALNNIAKSDNKFEDKAKDIQKDVAKEADKRQKLKENVAKYHELSYNKLREVAKSKGIDTYRIKKADLINKLASLENQEFLESTI